MFVQTLLILVYIQGLNVCKNGNVEAAYSKASDQATRLVRIAVTGRAIAENSNGIKITFCAQDHETGIVLQVESREFAHYLIDGLTSQDYSPKTVVEKKVIRDIKEKLCYVALHLESNAASFGNSNSREKREKEESPYGEVITDFDNSFSCPVSFKKRLFIGSRSPEFISNIKMKCSVGIREGLFDSKVSSTCSNQVSYDANIESRNTNAESESTVKIRIISPPERKYSVWIGGSILASLSTFQQMWLSDQEYDESRGNHHV